MNDETYSDVPGITYSRKRKFLFELKDILTGVAFPLIFTIVLSSTVIAFASYSGDLAISLIALIGGEIMVFGAMCVFGKANGGTAYKKKVLNDQKRSVNCKEETVVYRTGEYAVWKSVVIALIVCLPFIIFQTVQLIADNVFTRFCLQYICAWAYWPFSYLGEAYQALDYLMIIVMVVIHTLGYYWGKVQQINVQKRELEYFDSKKKGKKK